MLHDYEVWIKLFGAIQQIPWVTVIRWQLTIETYWNIISHLVEYSWIWFINIHVEITHLAPSLGCQHHQLEGNHDAASCLQPSLNFFRIEARPSRDATHKKHIRGLYSVNTVNIYTYTIVYNYYRILQMWHSIWQSIYNLTNIYIYYIYI